LRVIADYGADPVWSDLGGEDLDELPIYERLRCDLRAWAALYDTFPETKFGFQTRVAPWLQRTGKRLASSSPPSSGPISTLPTSLSMNRPGVSGGSGLAGMIQ
jgi:hypothetical protein